MDGLRALAVVPVVLYHAGFTAFGGGYVGVDVFFVISGYLITTIIADEIDSGRFSLRRFYERRARRILPALFLVVLVSLPFAWFWLMPRDLETFTYSVLSVATFTSNFFFWSRTGYFETSAELQPLLHTWSLAVEEQYYILFPLLMMLIWRRSVIPILVTLTIASLVLAEWALSLDRAAVFFLLPTRAWELLLGALAALYLRTSGAPRLRPVLCDGLAASGIALIAFAILVYDDGTRFPGLSALPPTVGTVLVILFARDGGVVQRLLSLRPLVGIGLISYGTYLWHQPVFALVQHRFGRIAFDQNVWLLIGLSFALAYVGYRLVEQPFRRRLPTRAVAWSMVGSAVVSVGAAVLIYMQVDKRPETVPSYRWALENADADLLRYVERRELRMDCGDQDRFGVQRCEFGDPQTDPTLVLWGDSLAGALLTGMERMARDRGLRGVAFVANGCPPVPGLANSYARRCNGDTHQVILDQIDALPGITDVVITGNIIGAASAGNVTIDGGEPSYAAVRDKMAEAVARLHAANLRVIFLEQGPVFAENVAVYLLQNLRLGIQEVPTIETSELLATRVELRGLADLPDLYIDPTEIFCGDTHCTSVDAEGDLVVYDHNHVTRKYSERLARLIAERAGF
ncbi:MAG: acyltransferase family protein [Roseovarius sp.]|uniref:acyltransferase family protein n=1 Tax=Roseovarius sp. TaxID=1486281 RepID=UPI0032EDF76F